jgi:hypothetical protein
VWFLVLLVVFVVVLAVWFLSLIATGPIAREPYGSWLAFLACLILGIVVFGLTWKAAFPEK